jgi:hypothetical protein
LKNRQIAVQKKAKFLLHNGPPYAKIVFAMNDYFKLIVMTIGAAQVAGMLPLSLQGATPPVPVPAVTPTANITNANPNAPHAQFEATSFDFGKVAPTDKPMHEFIVTNTGKSTLEITDVRPGCGCTTAGTWDKKIEPGKTGKIPLAFNPANFTGPVNKGATVTCTDPMQPSVYLHFTATVWRPLEIQPQYLYFMPIEGEPTNEMKTVRIVNNTEQPVSLETPQSASPAFKTELVTKQPGKEFELRVTFTDSPTNTRPQGNITINTSFTNMPVITINTVAMPQPAIVAMPQMIQIPASPLTPGYQYPAMIRNNGHTPVKLSEPTVNVEGTSVQMQEIEVGKNFRLNIAFPTNFTAKPGQAMELAVKTSNPKYPVLHVPITQAVPPPPVAVPAAASVNPNK